MKSPTVARLRALLRRMERMGRQLATMQQQWSEARAQALRRRAARARAVLRQGV